MKRLFLTIVFLGFCNIAYALPDNLWQGLIAESTSGNIDEYRAIASCVKNRQNKGLSCGLVALKRKDLKAFIARELKHNPKLEAIAKQAIKDTETRDYANGADHYEHTGVFKKPEWSKKMKVCLILFKNKQEITFWKG